MKDQKKRIELFCFYDRAAIESHLERMAQDGWMPEQIKGFLWIYRRIEPGRLRFAVEYSPGLSAPQAKVREFYERAKELGWRRAPSSGRFRILYSKREEAQRVGADPAVQLEAVHRSAKKNNVLPAAILLVLSLMNVFLFLWELIREPQQILTQRGAALYGILWIAMLILSAWEAGGYLLWHAQAWKAAQRGEFYSGTRSYGWARAGLLVLLAGAVRQFLGIFWSDSAAGAEILLTIAVYIIVMQAAVWLAERWVRKKQLSARSKKTATLLITGAAGFLLTVWVLIIVTSVILGM